MSNGLQPCTVRAGAPGANDDAINGYVSGSLWRNTAPAPDAIYVCADPSPGAAVWTLLPASVLLAAPRLGNVCTVDAVNGNDSTATRGGLPFLTPAAALAAAVAGDVVWILPGAYNLAAGLVVPNGVNISGLNHNAAILMLAVTVDTVLLTMGENSVIENVTLTLTSAGHHNLTGVLFPGTTAATSSLEGVTVVVDNHGAGDVGTSDVCGVRSTGSGSDANVDALKDCSIHCHSAGLGAKRGVLVDTAGAFFSCRNVLVHVDRTGAGLGTYIACESNFAGSSLFCRLGTIDGTPTADVSQTLGVLTVGNVAFLNHTANGRGFDSVAPTPQLDWGDPGAIGTGTFFMYRGTYSAVAAVEPKTRLTNKACLLNLAIRASVGPGAARVDTWTVRINGVDTALVATLTGAQTVAVITGISITAQAGDDVSLKMVTVASSTTSNVQATCNFV